GDDPGLVALRLAARALAHRELDAALVGAVDFGCEPVHRRASARPPGDAAIALVLKRLDDARRDGDRIHAVFDAIDDGRDRSAPHFGAGGVDLSTRFGEPFAARGLL